MGDMVLLSEFPTILSRLLYRPVTQFSSSGIRIVQRMAAYIVERDELPASRRLGIQ
jgi:hypothetical protein